MDVLQWLTGTEMGKLIFTVLVSMIPVIELRGAIPFGVSLGLSHWAAFLASVAGNLIPIPFIIVYIRRLFKWMRVQFPPMDNMITRLEKRAHLKGQAVNRYGFWGLLVFVAIPLPGTGAWTGALVAAFLDMRLTRAFPAIFWGVVLAGFIVTGITYGFSIFL